MEIKQELEAKIAELRQQLFAIVNAEKDAENAALVGRFFKTRDCYSCPESDADYWWRYHRVVSADDGCITVLMFYTDKDGDAHIKREGCFPPSCLGDEITAEEYELACTGLRNHVIGLTHQEPTHDR